MTKHHPCVGCRRARRVSSIDYNNITFSLPTEFPFVEGPEATLDRKVECRPGRAAKWSYEVTDNGG
jgi:hypothetical protein